MDQPAQNDETYDGPNDAYAPERDQRFSRRLSAIYCPPMVEIPNPSRPNETRSAVYEDHGQKNDGNYLIHDLTHSFFSATDTALAYAQGINDQFEMIEAPNDTRFSDR